MIFITGVSKSFVQTVFKTLFDSSVSLHVCVRQLLADSVSLVALAVACKSAWQQGMHLKQGGTLNIAGFTQMSSTDD